MAAAPDVHTMDEMQGERRASLALEQRREANTIALLDRQADLATLTDEEFARRLDQARVGMERMNRIFETLLVPGVHYGTKDWKGRAVFKADDLTQAGAQVLYKLFRLTPSRVGAPAYTITGDYTEATVTIALRDMAGRVVAERSGSCNSLESRFYERPRSRGRDDQAAAPIGEAGDLDAVADAQALKAEKRAKPLYADARETLHNCIAMAEKRAIKLATADAVGWSAFVKERGRKEIAAKVAAGVVAWSAEEKRTVMVAAQRAGITQKSTLRGVVIETLGHEPPSTGDEVTRVLAALAIWTPAAAQRQAVVTPVKDATDSYGEPPAAGSTPGA